MQHYPECRIMISSKEERYFGIGTYALLKKIKETKSVKEAAYELEMSYSKAWKILNQMEKYLKFEVLDRKQGGISGGNTELTQQGKKYMNSYEQILLDTKQFVEIKFEKEFSWLNDYSA